MNTPIVCCAQHAEWYGYGERQKMKPQSQQGVGGRTPHKSPPWKTSERVRTALATLRRGVVPSLSSTRIVTPFIDEAPDFSKLPCYCCKLPWTTACESPLLLGVEPPPSNLCLSLCSLRESQLTISQLLDATACDVALGISLPINTSELCCSTPRLRGLALSENHLDVRDIDHLAEWLKGSTKLQLLAITRNSVNDDGASWLADGVRMCTSLKRLRLSENLIGEENLRWANMRAKTRHDMHICQQQPLLA
jgi:hypothetical protein